MVRFRQLFHYRPVCVLQKAICIRLSHGLPAALRIGSVFPLPTLHWCDLRGGEVGVCHLRPVQAHRVSQYYCKYLAAFQRNLQELYKAYLLIVHILTAFPEASTESNIQVSKTFTCNFFMMCFTEHPEHYQQQLLLCGRSQHHSSSPVLKNCDRKDTCQQ